MSNAYSSASASTTAQAVRDALRDALARVNHQGDATASGAPAGFSEAQAVFGSAILDETRFNDSVRVARGFAAIVDPADRQLVLSLVTILANAESA